MLYWMWMRTKKPLEPKDNIFKPLLYFTPALLWGIFILYFSVMPGNEVPRFMIQFDDKLIHGGIYFFAAGLIYLGFIRFNFRNPISRVPVGFIVLLCILYGGAIEIVQHYFVPRRTGDWLDFLANTTGSVVCVLLCAVFHRGKA